MRVYQVLWRHSAPDMVPNRSQNPGFSCFWHLPFIQKRVFCPFLTWGGLGGPWGFPSCPLLVVPMGSIDLLWVSPTQLETLIPLYSTGRASAASPKKGPPPPGGLLPEESRSGGGQEISRSLKTSFEVSSYLRLGPYVSWTYLTYHHIWPYIHTLSTVYLLRKTLKNFF